MQNWLGIADRRCRTRPILCWKGLWWDGISWLGTIRGFISLVSLLCQWKIVFSRADTIFRHSFLKNVLLDTIWTLGSPYCASWLHCLESRLRENQWTSDDSHSPDERDYLRMTRSHCLQSILSRQQLSLYNLQLWEVRHNGWSEVVSCLIETCSPWLTKSHRVSNISRSIHYESFHSTTYMWSICHLRTSCRQLSTPQLLVCRPWLEALLKIRILTTSTTWIIQSLSRKWILLSKLLLIVYQHLQIYLLLAWSTAASGRRGMVYSSIPANSCFLTTYDLWHVRSRSTFPKVMFLGLEQVLLSIWLDCVYVKIVVKRNCQMWSSHGCMNSRTQMGPNLTELTLSLTIRRGNWWSRIWHLSKHWSQLLLLHAISSTKFVAFGLDVRMDNSRDMTWVRWQNDSRESCSAQENTEMCWTGRKEHSPV